MDSSTGTSASPSAVFRPLAARVGRQEADRGFLRDLRRRRPWSLSKTRPLGVELVRLPVYVLEVTLDSPRGGGPSKFLLSVDAVCGNVQRVDRSLELSRIEREGPGEATLLSAGLSESYAVSRARQETPWLRLRMAFKHRAPFPVDSVAVHDRIGYPYWVVHFERGGGRRDFRAIDGISGRKVGPKGRATLLRGIIASHAARGKNPDRR